ncbi:hypothetical protein D3C84_1009050 [compost metagenome]
MRHLRVRANLYALLRCVGIPLGAPNVCRESQAFTAKIQAQHGHLAVDILVIPFGVAGLLHAVETKTELVVFTKAPADIHGTADLAVGSVTAGE